MMTVLRSLFHLPRNLRLALRVVLSLERRLDDMQIALGRIETKLNQLSGSDNLQDWEFKVFSQWSEDGILQYLVRRLCLPPERRRFVEFGVQDFLESNCRFLMLKDNWSGLVIDGSASHIQAIRSHPDYWKYDLTAVHRFVTRENINGILRENGYAGKIGILSIDIDGNDYWVWEAIDVVQPAIVVVEFNSHFGPDADLSVPYDPAFERFQKHHSGSYWGASIRAFERLARTKGYFLAGSNSAGVNLFFVAEEFAGLVPATTSRREFLTSKFRDNRDIDGEFLFGSFESRVRALKGCPVWDFERDSIREF